MSQSRGWDSFPHPWQHRFVLRLHRFLSLHLHQPVKHHRLLSEKQILPFHFQYAMSTAASHHPDSLLALPLGCRCSFPQCWYSDRRRNSRQCCHWNHPDSSHTGNYPQRETPGTAVPEKPSVPTAYRIPHPFGYT